jgi:hypothetical protein
MKNEHPILFSTSMVQAILEGRKSQTRRVIKPQPPIEFPHPFISLECVLWSKHTAGDYPMSAYNTPLRYKVGDKLWVRETWANSYEGTQCQFRADGKPIMPPNNQWRPSIFMPRWASRITLEITDIRVQRVQEITEADAVAEGTPINDFFPMNTAKIAGLDTVYFYTELWDSINGKTHSWASNPFVWCISFKRIKPA